MQKLKPALVRLRHSRSFEAVFIVLVVVSLMALAAEFFMDLDESTAQRLGRINVSVAWLFLFDFIIGLIISYDKKAYWKSDWWLLLASIPIDEYFFGSLRIFRLMRAFRIYGITARPGTIRSLRKQRERYSRTKQNGKADEYHG